MNAFRVIDRLEEIERRERAAQQQEVKREEQINRLMKQFMQVQWNTFKAENYPFEVISS